MECIQALDRRNGVSRPSSCYSSIDDGFALIEEPQFHSAAASLLIRLPETASIYRDGRVRCSLRADRCDTP
jgi:hypothetical protein